MYIILFRGRSANTGEWVEGYYVKHNRKHYIVRSANENVVDWFAVLPETVGQYTGLTDKNGKRIFQGDIVRYYSSYSEQLCGEPGVVSYGAFNCSCCDGVYGWEFGECDIRNHEDHIVIGNIHDNPDLIGGKV